MNLFKKKTVQNNAAKLKVLENRIKVLTDSLENESESVDIYKNEYQNLLKKYQNLNTDFNFIFSSMKLIRAVLIQNSEYIDEDLAFKTVQSYSNYIKCMIDMVIDYYSPEEKEKKKDQFNISNDGIERLKFLRSDLISIANCMISGSEVDPSNVTNCIDKLNAIIGDDKAEEKPTDFLEEDDK